MSMTTTMVFKVAKHRIHKALSRLSDIARYLEEAGFTDNAKSVYDAMAAIDGKLPERTLMGAHQKDTNNGKKIAGQPGIYLYSTSHRWKRTAPQFYEAGKYVITRGDHGWNLYESFPTGQIDSYDTLADAKEAAHRMEFDDEDNLDDNIRPDEQYNTGGSTFYSGEAGGGSPSLFSIDVAEKLASLANDMDQKGLYDEASDIDEVMLEYLKELANKASEVSDEDDNIDALVGANGIGNVGVTDAGGFAGLSDSYFYRSHDNLEGVYGPQDR